MNLIFVFTTYYKINYDYNYYLNKKLSLQDNSKNNITISLSI